MWRFGLCVCVCVCVCVLSSIRISGEVPLNPTSDLTTHHPHGNKLTADMLGVMDKSRHRGRCSFRLMLTACAEWQIVTWCAQLRLMGRKLKLCERNSGWKRERERERERERDWVIERMEESFEYDLVKFSNWFSIHNVRSFVKRITGLSLEPFSAFLVGGVFLFLLFFIRFWFFFSLFCFVLFYFFFFFFLFLFFFFFLQKGLGFFKNTIHGLKSGKMWGKHK